MLFDEEIDPQKISNILNMFQEKLQPINEIQFFALLNLLEKFNETTITNLMNLFT